MSWDGVNHESISKTSSRRGFLSKAATAAASAGVVLGGTGNVAAASEETVSGTMKAYDGSPVPYAHVDVLYSDGGTDTFADPDGYFEVSVPAGTDEVFLAMYKTAGSFPQFLSPRLNGVPHVHTIGHRDVPDGESDLGEIQLPEAHKIDIRAVLAEQKGVENARPEVRSLYPGFDWNYWFAIGPWTLTSDENGYMTIDFVDFTGLELAGPVQAVMEPPKDDPRFDDVVHTKDIRMTEDTTVEFDISRRATRGRGR